MSDDTENSPTMPPGPAFAAISSDMAELRLAADRTFQQTTWLCKVVAAMIEQMPPQMRPQIKD